MTQPTRYITKLDPEGRLCLPPSVRESLALHSGTQLHFSLDEQTRAIRLRPVQRACLFCQSTEQLHDITSGLFLCDSCFLCLKY